MANSYSADAESQKRPLPAWLVPGIVLVVAAAVYGAFGVYAALKGSTSAAEVGYLVRSWWFISGQMPLAAATAGDMPLYYLLLGLVQNLIGQGHLTGRILSLVLGAGTAVLLFQLCRRLTANASVSAMAVLVFIVTPATAYTFATATPVALISFLHVLALHLMLFSMGRPRWWVSILFGLLLLALVFTRQSMILSVVILAPLFVVVVGRQRALQALLMIAAFAAGIAAVYFVLAHEIALEALRGPVLMAAISGLLPPDAAAVYQATQRPFTFNAFTQTLSLTDVVNGLLLPFVGTILLAVAMFFLAGRALRPLLVIPAYFVFLLITAYLWNAGAGCGSCVIADASVVMVVGALTAAITLALIWRKCKSDRLPAIAVTLLLCIGTLWLNAFAPGFTIGPAAVADKLRNYPEPMLRQIGNRSEIEDITALTRVLAPKAPAGKSVLVIHDKPALVYAVTQAGRKVPVQSLDLAASRRAFNGNVGEAARTNLLPALTRAGLWTEETMRGWIDGAYDVVVFQEGTRLLTPELEATLDTSFDVVHSANFRGNNIRVYVRRPAASPPA